MQPEASFHLAARYTNRVELLEFHDKAFKIIHSLSSKQCKVCCFSKNGQYLAIGGDDGVFVHNMDTNESDRWSEDVGVISVQFSPSNKYFGILSQFSHEKCPQNLKIYEFETKNKIYSCCQKNYQKWCPQWPDDERFACSVQKGQIRFMLHDNATINDQTELLSLKNVQELALSPNGAKFISTFTRQSNQNISAVTVFCSDTHKSIINLNMFNIDECDLKWNFSGSCVLALCQNTNTTANSYYGESKLFFLDAVNIHKQEVCFSEEEIDLNVSDCNWSPVSDEFCVVFDLTHAAIFDKKLQRLKNLTISRGVRNGVQYHCFGEFIALTGSGNVKSNFEIWRRPNDGNTKSIKPISGQIDVPYATVFRWCLGGYFLLAATTFPRLRQDNGYYIYNLVGQKLISVKVEENNLTELIWRPISYATETCIDINSLLENLKLTKQEEMRSNEISAKPKSTKYIPPHLRGDQNDKEFKCLHSYPVKAKSKKSTKKTLPPGLG